MNAKEFIDEVHNSSIMPENFDEMYSRFQFYQGLVLGALKQFHQVCIKNNINYQLAFGSLLGAIRDDGQIPWDYDIDVFVPFYQRLALVEALRADLDEDYYFDCTENSIDCKNELIRVAPKGYRSEVIHVDVFFLCPEPDDELEFAKHTKSIRKICNARHYKTMNIKAVFMEKKKRGLYYFFKKMQHIFYSYDSMHKEYMRLCSQYDYNTAKRFINANGFAGTYYMLADNMRETMDYQTSVGVFRIPVNYEAVLTREFHDYHQIMDLQVRLDEIRKNLTRIEIYNSLYNINTENVKM